MREMVVPSYSLEEGKLYRVKIDDCCVSGEFTSVLKDKGEMTFENGVTLDVDYGCIFYEVETEDNILF